jgi:hypothetical protein
VNKVKECDPQILEMILYSAGKLYNPQTVQEIKKELSRIGVIKAEPIKNKLVGYPAKATADRERYSRKCVDQKGLKTKSFWWLDKNGFISRTRARNNSIIVDVAEMIKLNPEMSVYNCMRVVANNWNMSYQAVQNITAITREIKETDL